jgi:GntR family transcriptional regulator/MocR family aminotransferase
MNKCSTAASLFVKLETGSPRPLYAQLYDELREAILEGRLAVGTRLPSTRVLATELGVSRNTVMTAFSRLQSEGYLEGQVGSGTYVSSSLPESLLQVRSDSIAGLQNPSGRKLSQRGQIISGTPPTLSDYQSHPRAFQTGLPALDEFPSRTWKKLHNRIWNRPPLKLLGYGEPAGYRPLREAIADHLCAARAVRCSWEQVVIVSGSQQAMDLAARLLLDPGDAAWMENPGYPGTRAALTGAGARLWAAPVDEQGLDVRAAESLCPSARLAYVTPSHQYPLGVTMSLSRRLDLLDWAKRSDAWVLEDDYDSEFRYAGRPFEALQGLDVEGRVVYMGTFSKILFPALRLGYLVIPQDLVDAFVAARELSDLHSPSIEQAVLTDFILEGHFGRHIRRMRALYAERQAALVEAVTRDLEGALEVRPASAGLHLIGWLRGSADDRMASRVAASWGVDTIPLSWYADGPPRYRGLMMGYAATSEPEIRQGTRKLAAALENL